MGTTTSQTTDDVDAILAGMRRSPPAVQPGYTPPMPPQIQPRPAPASAFGNAVFGSSQPQEGIQSWPGPGSSYGNAPPPPPARPDDSGSGLTPSPYSNQPTPPQPPQQGTDPRNRSPDEYRLGQPIWHPRPGEQGYQVAANRPIAPPPPRFQQGNQPGPWPAAYPNSPQINPQNAPALPGETPQETADLNRHMGHESQGQNIMNNDAARNPALYYDPRNPRTCQGYWQIVNSTWRDGAQKAGVDTRQWPTAMSAPYQVQRQVALALYRAYGNKPWDPQPGAGEHGDRAALAPQQPLSPQPRGSEDWGSAPPRDFGPGPTGQQGPFGQAANMQPGQSGFTRVLNSVGPLLLGIASLALRLPLSTAITAYGAMAKAQDNGQKDAYDRARTQFQDQLKEANAQQALESHDASDAFSEYGNNNPQGLQQTLAQIALKYNDPVMYRMAERGDLNGIHQLQQRRDLYNQDLTKLNRAAQDEQDRQAQDAAVAALDRQYQQAHPNATPDELAVAHNQHIGEASKAGTKTDTSDAEEAAIYNVLGPDKQPTGQQVRAGKQGGLFDVGTKQSVQLKPGETIAPETRGTAGGGLEATKPYDVVDKDGKVVRTVLGRERKDQPGILDSETGEPIKLDPGQTLQPHARSSVASPLETGKPFDIVDEKGHVVPGGQGVMLRERRDGAGYVYAETGDPLKLEPGQHVRQITPTTSGGGRAGAQVLRQLVGGREVLSDLQNVVRLPVGTTTGPLGQVQPGPTIAGALTGDLTRTLTDQDSQLMQASMASMERELSVLMSPVYGGNWAAQQISPLIPKSGDTIQTVMFKLSRLAQSADNALEAASKSPILSNEEQEYAKDLRKQISEAIPWSTAEAMDFAYRGQPHETFGDYAKREGIGGGGQQGAEVPPMTEQQYNTAPSGTRYRLPTDPPNTVRIKP